jgi:hypothetical protein
VLLSNAHGSPDAGKIKVRQKKVPRDSFFNFFSPPDMPDPDDPEAEMSVRPENIFRLLCFVIFLLHLFAIFPLAKVRHTPLGRVAAYSRWCNYVQCMLAVLPSY